MIVVEAVLSLLVELMTKKGVAKIGAALLRQKSVITKAIEDTDSALYGKYENLTAQLKQWLEPRDIDSIRSVLSLSGHDEKLDCEVTSFLGSSGFVYPENPRDHASCIVKTFYSKLYQRMLADEKSAFGIFDNRLQNIDSTNRQAHAETQRLLSEAMQELSTSETDLSRSTPLMQSTGVTQTVDLPPSNSEFDAVADSQIELAKSFMKEGKTRSALESLLKIRDLARFEKLSNEAQYSIVANIGLCYLTLGQSARARESLARAMSLKPDSAKANANMALACLAQDDLGEALRLSREAVVLDATQPHVLAVRIRTLSLADCHSDLDALVQEYPLVVSDRECLLELARAYVLTREEDRARHYFGRVLQIDSADIDACFHFGLLLTHHVVAGLDQPILLDFKVTKPQREDCLLGIKLFDECITFLRNSDYDELHLVARVNRAVLRSILGMTVEALSDLDAALVIHNDDYHALLNKGLLCIKAGRHQQAVDCFGALALGPQRLEATCLLALTEFDRGEYQNVIDTLEPVLVELTSSSREAQMLEMVVDCKWRLKTDWDAPELLARLEVLAESDFAASCALSRHHLRRTREYGRSAEYAKRAIEQSTANRMTGVPLRILAESQEQLGEIQAARDTYESLVACTKSLSDLTAYVEFLYRNEMYSEALTTARNARGSGPPIRGISEIEALILAQFAGDQSTAADLVSKLIHNSETPPRTKVLYSELQFSIGDRTGAISTLESIDVNALKSDSEALLHAANMRARLQLPGALELARLAWEQQPDNERTCAGYLQLMHVIAPNEQLVVPPEEVVGGSVVVLNEAGDHKCYYISERGESVPDAFTVTANGPLYSRLVGSKLNDVLELRSTRFDQLTAQVVDIQTIYVHLYRYLLNNFTRLFPDTKMLFRIQVDPHDPKALLELLDNRAKEYDAVLGLYRRKQITAGTVAQQFSTSVIDVINTLATSRDGVILAARGSAKELQEERMLLLGANTIVLDSTAVVAVAGLDLAEELRALGMEILVSKAVLEDIERMIEQLTQKPAASMTIWKEGGEYVKMLITNELVLDRQQYLNSLILLVEKIATVVSYEGILDIPKDQRKQLLRGLGVEALTSVLLTSERSAVLWSDDLGLREIASSGWHVRCVWTQSLLDTMLERQIVNDDRYDSCLINLVLSNYRFVCVRHKTVMKLLQETSFSVTHELQKVLSTITANSGCTADSALRVMCELTRALMLENLMAHQYEILLDLFAKVLSEGRDRSSVMKSFVAEVSRLLTLAPIQQKRFKKWWSHYKERFLI